MNTAITKERLKELEVEIHKREVDVTQVNDKISKLKDQLFLVTNNKQYDALMTEIDHRKDKRSSFESESIDFLEAYTAYKFPFEKKPEIFA
mgnify:CR=1 FL=1